MKMEKNERSLDNKISLGICFCIIIIFSLIIVVNIYSIDTNLNSEVSFEMIFAKQVQEEGSLLPRNFYYGYELSAIRPAAFAALVNCFLNNIMLSYAFSMIISALVILFSLYYLMKQMGLGNGAVLIGILAYFGLSSYENMYVACLYNGYFGSYIAVVCIVIGYYLRCFREEKMNCLFFLLGGVAFLFGLMGIRMLETLYIPLAVFDVLYNGYRIYRCKKLNFNTIKYTWYLLICSSSGFLIFHLVLKSRYILGSVPSDTNFVSLDAAFEGTGKAVIELLNMLNIIGNVKVFSYEGIVYLLSISVFLIVCFGIYLFLHGKKEKSHKAVLGIFLISILMTIFVLGFTEWKIAARYFFVAPILYAVVLGMLYDSLKGHSKLLSYFLLIVIALTISGNLYKIYKPIVISVWQKPEEEMQIIEYLEDNNVNHGFGFLNGLQINPISNFDVKLSYLIYDEVDNEFVCTNSMSSGDSYSPRLAKERSFLLVSNSDKELYYEKWKNTALFENSYIEKVFNTYTIYIFDFNILVDNRME